MFAVDHSTFEHRTEMPSFAVTVTAHWRKTGALGLPSVQDIDFEQWLALYDLAERDNNVELQDAALCHMDMSVTLPRQAEISGKIRMRIAERRVAQWK